VKNSARRPARPTTVLIADDDAAVLEALRELIDDEPRLELIAAAESVDEALAAARRQGPDVALVDVQMPDGGGERLARELREISRGTRVVAHSAFDDAATVRSMVRSGAKGYLAKGRSGTDLVEVLLGFGRGEELFQVQSGLFAEMTLGEDRVMRALFDDSPVGLMLVGPRDRKSWPLTTRKNLAPFRANRALCSLLGYTEAQLCGMSVEELTHPDDQSKTDSHFEPLFRGQTTEARFEKRYLTSSGATVWTDVTSTVIRDDHGAPMHFLTVVVDITERKQGEAALHESEQRLRSIVEGLPGFVYICAIDDLLSTTYVSPQVETIFGFSPAEYIADPMFWPRVIHPDDRARVTEAFRESVFGGAVFEMEYRLVLADGGVRWVRDHATTVRDVTGKLLYCQGVVLDITESMQVEQARAESLAKTKFLAGMSHELRTPLNSVIGFAQLLADGDFGELNERQARFISHIQSAGRQLLGLVNDVLDLSKVQAGQMELEVEPVAVRAAVADALTQISPMAARAEVSLTVHDCADRVALADRRRLAQVFLNLLSNAVKFSSAGGAVEVSCSGDGENVRIAVRDQGIGIAVADQGRIFEEFRQVGDRTRATEGTGLGLALTRQLLHAMQGEIEVESELGKGSVFTVTLPAA
jgi:PAS domain S-box-containing protein